ncbi:uncharacterized protein SAPINGB_P003426 [Magnusiomyces paraingens]|uniref:Metal homeostatis protein bsd2 n=1 Tax=Magnusiomyces paraingens TaxID=2606893 RepID=A0A5E8BWS0_9ASCO|nr:uncharacterized protein SAPINGB_P003426 [Saprochaete ingens]VVT53145.1 unnamed protein product [Saprochaete ingens]
MNLAALTNPSQLPQNTSNSNKEVLFSAPSDDSDNESHVTNNSSRPARKTPRRTNDHSDAEEDHDMLMEDAFGGFSDSDVDSEDWDDRRIEPTAGAGNNSSASSSGGPSTAQRLRNKIFSRGPASSGTYVSLEHASSEDPIPMQDLPSSSSAPSSLSAVNTATDATSSSSSSSSSSITTQDHISSSHSSHLLLPSPSPSSTSQPIPASAAQNRGDMGGNGGFFNRGLFSWRRNTSQATRSLSFNNQNDGVFNNITAKPETEKPEDSDVPPTYEEAAADAAPLYWETTIMAPGYSDEIFIDGLPVGSPINFIWNMMVSAAFQFVGFLLTYLLHTSHAAKHGSRAGLGFTLFQYGFYLQPSINGSSSSSSGAPTGPDREFEPSDPNNYDLSSNHDDISGSYHKAAIAASSVTTTSSGDPSSSASGWISIILMVLGFCIVAKSIFDYVRVRRMEMMIVQSPSSVIVDPEDADNMV